MNPTTSSVRLGRLLAEMRVAAGLTVREVAARLGCSAPLITQQEKGVRAIKPDRLYYMVLGLYGGDSNKLAAMEYLRRKTEDPPGWMWTETGAHIEEHFRVYLGLEADAELIQIAALDVIPGLLQSEEYMRRQANAASAVPPDVRERYVGIRLRRQQRLVDEENPLRLQVAISEAALIRAHAEPCGSQIKSLIEKAELPTVEIRVVPLLAGQHNVTGAFSILSHPRDTLPPIIYQPGPIGGHLVEESGAVKSMICVYKDYLDLTKDRADSLDLIKKVGMNG